MTKRNRKLPPVKISDVKEPRTLPFNGSAVTDNKLSFSFSCFDRNYKLFNLGGDGSDGVISGKWFVELFDCLKSIGNKTITELKQSKTHNLHPVDWDQANTSPPKDYEQLEYWQFRINKSRGRVIGIIIDGIFYVVWFDPYHNLTDSEGYGTIRTYPAPEIM